MGELRDKSGKTESEFLREYDITKYFRPSVTVDAVLCVPKADGGRLLLIKRGGHPFIGDYAFPGGFVEKDEPCETAAARELCEETGIAGVPLRQLVTVSTPDRDPRWRNITVIFTAALDKEIPAVGSDDAALAEWFDFTVEEKGSAVKIEFAGSERFACKLDVVRDAFGAIDINNTKIVERGKMAFDHAKLTYYLFDALRLRK